MLLSLLSVRAILIGVMVVCFTEWAIASDEQIVRINAILEDGTISAGTGCLWGDDGVVLTAYHVLENADSVFVYTLHGEYDEIEVVSYASDYDLALLRILDSTFGHDNVAGFPTAIPDDLDLSDVDEFEMVYYPWDYTQSHELTCKPTNPYLVRSLSFTNRDGSPLFARDILVISLDVKGYSGASGAPIVFNDEVYGVFSGSLTEGGSLGWAIPVTYLVDNMKSVGLSPASVSWDKLSLMDPSVWRAHSLSEFKPPTQIKLRLGGLIGHKADEFNTYIASYFDDYQHNLSYGFEVGMFTNRYHISYATLPGLENVESDESDYRFFANLFLLRKQYNIRRWPYLGVSAGLPVNLQLRAGARLMSLFDLEVRLSTFKSEIKDYEFDTHGQSVETIEKSWTTNLYFGLNATITI